MFYWITIGVLGVYGLISTFYCIRFALLLLKVEDALQESIETIDDRHDNILNILKIPLFYDSPEVKQVLRDIETTRESLDHVAVQLSNKTYTKEEDDQVNEG